MPKKIIDEEDLEEDTDGGLFDHGEVLDTLLATPQAQKLFEKAGGVLDALGGLIDKAAKGELGKGKPKPEKVPISARAVLHFSPKEALTEEKIRARRKALAKLAHPDAGGSDLEMQRVNKAAEILLKGLKK
jgi:hypothetical protein